jgi:alpha-1,2-mannosyltransferase
MSVRRQALLVAGTAIAVGVFLATVPTFREFFDLGVYRGAVRWWLLDGGDLYDFRYQQSDYGFTYPPFAALVFSPLIATSWPVAVAISLALNVAAVLALLRWYLVPVLIRHDWPIWTPCALAFLAILVFEPARDTFSFGQVNLALLVLACADLKALLAGPEPGAGHRIGVPAGTGHRSPAVEGTGGKGRWRRWAGIGIGLATAVKLTPAVFIGYLIVARRYRAAAVAAATAVGATVLAALIAPNASRAFWTDALWDTERVGKLAYVSNQSLRGVVARAGLPTAWWVAAVALLLITWLLLVRHTDLVTGFAATGILACLVSPVTWVHHLVWLLPALFLLLGDALDRRDRRRLVPLAAAYVVLSSSVVWLWWTGTHGWAAMIGSNTYAWISLALLAAVTIMSTASSAQLSHR